MFAVGLNLLKLSKALQLLHKVTLVTKLFKTPFEHFLFRQSIVICLHINNICNILKLNSYIQDK